MNPTYITYNGITLNDANGYYITMLDGVFSVPIRTAEDQKTGYDGGHIWNRLYDMRTITIEGDIVGNGVYDFYAKVRSIVNAFNIGNQQSLPLSIGLADGNVKTILAKVITMPQIPLQAGQTDSARFQIMLKSESPYFQDLSSGNYNIPLSTFGGFPVASCVPTPVGTTNQILYINNGGSVPSYASLTITGNINNPSVRSGTTGDQFTVNTSLVTGDKLVIQRDNNGINVTKNGINYIQYFTGSFINISQGNNAIYFSASNYDSSANLNVQFSNSYISL